ncbi:hypothetical protein HYW21_03150 [Candidatus Woesearchaeota archaeon]|nr:hypothetical protein [Candidatus Woesearchaeota archaeon]
MITKALHRGWNILVHPDREFSVVYQRRFESVLIDYLILLVTLGIVAGFFNFGFGLARAFYFEMALSADVQYLRLVNYLAGMSLSLAFLYFFLGTFILFMGSILIKGLFAILKREMKYTHLLMTLFYAATPLLLFGWIPVLPYALFIWSILLFITGISYYKNLYGVAKDSIAYRD